MPDLNPLLNGFRFAAGLPGFPRKSITPGKARSPVRRLLEELGSNFLRMVKTSVFGYEKNPYQRLFAKAGCGFGDLEKRSFWDESMVEDAWKTLPGDIP